MLLEFYGKECPHCKKMSGRALNKIYEQQRNNSIGRRLFLVHRGGFQNVERSWTTRAKKGNPLLRK